MEYHQCQENNYNYIIRFNILNAKNVDIFVENYHK